MSESADRLVRRWLVVAAVAVVVAVAVGGITRLTESGLSITEWQPVAGVLPPLTDEAWAEAYRQYQAIPEAQTVHLGITLEAFKGLYRWEWVHRLLARLVGLILAVPYFVFLSRGQLRPEHRRRLLLLPVLALAQGVLGWYMVSSGLSVRTSVSPYRLTAHLGMALVIYAACVWTILELSARRREAEHTPRRIRRLVRAGVVLTFITLLSGGFVAGLDAGKIFNTFPLMAGHIVPPGYFSSGMGWRAAFENPLVAQFNHRLLALGTATFLLVMAAICRRATVPPGVRTAMTVSAIVVLGQVALGISTLLLRVPITIAVVHQVMGLMVLTAVLTATYRAHETR
jgi:cytochrome c oxidase assembly protein subunit 15